MTKKKKYKFTGGNAYFISGVPARDLTIAEFDNLKPAQQKRCLKSGLYIKPAQNTEGQDG